mmetsp:Transcript_11671/g.21099  ORF Transcript_11671/g.21099 Transcript_11671/m.21099 type:complete len:259 (+) Transcript_11671:356-1132(+)
MSSPSSSALAMTMGRPCRASTCCRLDFTLGYISSTKFPSPTFSLVHTRRTGISSSTRASGPCFSSPRWIPSLCTSAHVFSSNAASRQVAIWYPRPMHRKLWRVLDDSATCFMILETERVWATRSGNVCKAWIIAFRRAAVRTLSSPITRANISSATISDVYAFVHGPISWPVCRYTPQWVMEDRVLPTMLVKPTHKAPRSLQYCTMASILSSSPVKSTKQQQSSRNVGGWRSGKSEANSTEMPMSANSSKVLRTARAP